MTAPISYPFSDAGVAEGLAALGTTANAVATNLSSMGFQGKAFSESDDALSRYLVDSIPGASSALVYLDPKNDAKYAVVFDGFGGEIAADLPLPVQEFIPRYDACDYPELIEEMS